jgi:DNA processing protein
MASDQMNLIALCSIPALGPVTVRRLLAAFGTPEAVFRAAQGQLASVDGIDSKRAEAIKAFSGEALERDLEKLKGEGIRVITTLSEEYPEALREVPSAPLVLYVKGEIRKENRFAIAVVGTRTPSPYGVSVTERMASELASTGFTVVSGLARGIDSAAHRGSLRAGGRGIAVLGSGMDVPYPPENRGLMERLAGSGAVLTEFPPGTRPFKGNFPMRNRIISGLALGVLIVEAARDSGALITARHALEQNKEVFAIPGNINSAASSGTNELIRQGARIVVRAQDIVEELAPVLKGFIKSAKAEKAEISSEEKAICDIMTGEPRHVDALSRQSGLTASKTLALLLHLELKGVVKQTEGKMFHLA